jgi:hypothetical protein
MMPQNESLRHNNSLAYPKELQDLDKDLHNYNANGHDDYRLPVPISNRSSHP